MAKEDRDPKAERAAARAQVIADEESAAESERALGRALALGVPVVTVVASVVVGMVTSAGPALLVLGGGALLGTITLVWASLRTLGGDAPLPADLELLAARADTSSPAAEKKRAALRALKDLENERALGKIDDADYAELSRRYREEAKEVLRELDEAVEPLRAAAEELAAKYLAKRGLGPEDAKDAKDAKEPDDEGDADDRDADEIADKRACAKCATINDADAAFCKKCGSPLAAAERDEDATENKDDEQAATS